MVQFLPTKKRGQGYCLAVWRLAILAMVLTLWFLTAGAQELPANQAQDIRPGQTAEPSSPVDNLPAPGLNLGDLLPRSNDPQTAPGPYLSITDLPGAPRNFRPVTPPALDHKPVAPAKPAADTAERPALLQPEARPDNNGTAKPEKPATKP